MCAVVGKLFQNKPVVIMQPLVFKICRKDPAHCPNIKASVLCANTVPFIS